MSLVTEYRGRIEEVVRNSECSEGLSERLRNAAVSCWNETKIDIWWKLWEFNQTHMHKHICNMRFTSTLSRALLHVVINVWVKRFSVSKDSHCVTMESRHMYIISLVLNSNLNWNCLRMRLKRPENEVRETSKSCWKRGSEGGDLGMRQWRLENEATKGP